MTPAEKKEAYRQRCRDAEAARREALGLPQHPLAKPVRQRKARNQFSNGSTYASDTRAGELSDDLGLSPDY